MRTLDTLPTKNFYGCSALEFDNFAVEPACPFTRLTPGQRGKRPRRSAHGFEVESSFGFFRLFDAPTIWCIPLNYLSSKLISMTGLREVVY